MNHPISRLAERPQTLRDILGQDENYAKNLQSIENHVRYLFGQHPTIPFFTVHDADHCENVEGYLNKLILSRLGEGRDDFVPNPLEAFLLLSAAWLHDIGMIIGLFPGDGALGHEDIRNDHEVRAAEYVARWPIDCDLGPRKVFYCAYMNELILHHRKKADLDRIVATEELDTRSCRLRVLAALLRLADACDIDYERAPDFLQRLYESVGMRNEHLPHWEKAHLVERLEFGENIQVHAMVPRPEHGFGFDGIVRQICTDLEEELGTVQHILSDYSNLTYRSVKGHSTEVFMPPVMEALTKAFWPHIVLDQTSAGATVERLAVVLQVVCDGSRSLEATKALVEDMFYKTLELRPNNYAQINFLQELGSAWQEAESIDELVKLIQDKAADYLSERARSLQRIESQAGLVSESRETVLVVYGYSTCVFALLRGIEPKNRGDLYVAAVRGRTHIPWLPGPPEGVRMARKARELGYNVSYVEVPWISSYIRRVLSEDSHRKVKILMGARGIKGDGSVINTPGNLMIAIAAKEQGIPVFVIAENMKSIREERSDVLVDKPASQFWDVPESQWLNREGIPVRRPYADVIPPTLITGIITEGGILQTGA